MARDRMLETDRSGVKRLALDERQFPFLPRLAEKFRGVARPPAATSTTGTFTPDKLYTTDENDPNYDADLAGRVKTFNGDWRARDTVTGRPCW